MWSWVGPDERAAGLDHAAVVQLVVEHPAADPVAGLDHEHRAAAASDPAGGDQAGDAGADDDHVDPAGERSPAVPVARRASAR